MIVQVVGTNGSGKTTVVKAVIARAALVGEPEQGDFAYVYQTYGVEFAVLGKYNEVGTSGCDRIKDVQSVYDRVAELDAVGRSVLFEGIRMMNHTRGLGLVRRLRAMTIVQLTTTPEECIAAIKARQALVGREKPISERDVRSSVVRAHNYAYKLSCLGAKVVRASRDEAPGKVLEILSKGEVL